MRKQHYIFILLFTKATLTFACFDTYQFKIFPIGLLEENIVTIDFKIRRSSEYLVNQQYYPSRLEGKPGTIMWIFSSFISVYNKNQQIISLIPIETKCSNDKKYNDTLSQLFTNCLKKISNKYPNIKLFKPISISFCDYQHKCSNLKYKFDTLTQKDILIFDGQKYQTNIFKDSSYYGLDKSVYKPNRLFYLTINSIRVLKADNTTIVVSHFTNGEDIDLDIEKTKVSKEFKPKWTFTDIKKSYYKEPVLHHGYGLDIFFIK
jgi:hypothetical protein